MRLTFTLPSILEPAETNDVFEQCSSRDEMFLASWISIASAETLVMTSGTTDFPRVPEESEGGGISWEKRKVSLSQGGGFAESFQHAIAVTRSLKMERRANNGG